MRAQWMAAMASAIVVAGTAVAAPVTPDLAGQFTVGTATYDQVVTKLGRPQMVTTNADGSTIIAYTSNRTRVKAASYIPYVGLLAGGAKATASSVIFTFGPDHILKSTSTTETNVSCNMLGNCGP